MSELHVKHLSQILGFPAQQISLAPVSGGCISQAFKVTVATNNETSESNLRQFFAKTNSFEFLDNFHAEARGLNLLRQSNTLRIPKPVAIESMEQSAYLVMDWIENPKSQKSSKPQFYERFGQQLAELHRLTSGEQIGLQHDNYLGAAHQLNQTEPTWLEFFAKHRLGYQLRWGLEQGTIPGNLHKQLDQIIDALPRIIVGDETSTSLLHGDLWSGNYLADENGEPTLIDPAVYYGHREAEFGMLKLFGSCPTNFYDAYHEAWPLEEDWEYRNQVYILYHLLNHLNLFGSGYLGDCLQLSRKILERIGRHH